MTTERTLEIQGLQVTVQRKAIKNLHLAVYPPDGRVRVSAPLYVSDEAVRLAVIPRLGWIRRQQAKFAAQARQPVREMAHGESHYIWGRRCLLLIEERYGPPQIAVHDDNNLVLRVRPGTDPAKRRAILNSWYRAELEARLPDLVAKWEPVIGVRVAEWRIRRMKTRWGTCNVQAQRIWFNLELAKKSPHCLEYVLVHEMVHLIERRHNAHFRALMDQFMPQWRLYKRDLTGLQDL